MKNSKNLSSSPQTLFSPAKLNLTLQVHEFCPKVQKHRVETEMCTIPLKDVITITPVVKKKIQISLKGPYSKGIPNNEKNSVHKALKHFFSHRPFSEGFCIDIEKNIPTGSGLGGGSSNAGTVLRYLHERYNIPLVPEEYSILGSDIPFFASGLSHAHVAGFGENISPLSPRTPSVFPPDTSLQGMVLLSPSIHISTPWAYQQLKWDRESQNTPFLLKDISPLQNDFSPLIFSRFYDVFREWKNIQSHHPQKIIRRGITGKGPTLFAFWEKGTKQDFTPFSNAFHPLYFDFPPLTP